MLSVAASWLNVDDADLADKRDAAGMMPKCRTQSEDRCTAKSRAKGRYEMQAECKLQADLLAMQVQGKYAIQKQKSHMCKAKKLPQQDCAWEAHLDSLCNV